jgi:hypothetical protein
MKLSLLYIVIKNPAFEAAELLSLFGERESPYATAKGTENF